MYITTYQINKPKNVQFLKFKFLTTVNVRKPNVRLSVNAEIRTSACSIHKRSDFGHPGHSVRVRISDNAKLDRFIYKGGHKQDFLLYKMV